MAFIDAVWLGNSWLQHLQFLGAIIAGIILGKMFFWLSKNIIKGFTKKTKTRLDDLLIESLERPVVFLLFTAGFYIGSTFLTLGERGAEIFGNVTAILVTLNIAWFIMNILDAIIENFLKPAASRSKSDLDDALIPIIRKSLRFVIVIITIVMIVDNFGYDVTTLVAGLGLGGLAFALAAQDLLSNLFGGFAILSDKPFKLGDRIRLDDKNDGFVREIGIRTTRIETLDGTMIVIPNSKIADTILENVSREQARKVKVTIGVTYDTSDKKLEEAKKIIADVIEKNPDTKDNSLISFFNFGDSALEILVIYWIRNFDNLLGARDHVNTQIKKRFDKAKIEFAYPTQTVYVKK